MSEPATLPMIRVQLFLKKKDDVTDEFFHEHWKGNHVRLALENKNFVDRVIRYNQYHTSPRLREAAGEFKIPVQEFDGVAEVWVKDIESWKSIVSDADFQTAIVEDEDKFIKKPIHIMIGYDNTVIGEAVKAN